VSGHEEAIDMLVDKYKNPLYKLCYHLSEEKFDAEDLFQETWIRVIKNLKRYDCDRAFRTWLFSICINLYKDKYRKKKRWLSVIKEYFSDEDKDHEMENASDEYPLPEEKLISNMEKGKLRKNLSMLEDIYRIPILLYYFKDISYNDMAAILQIPVGTVKSRLNYARGKLKKMMEVDINE
jgi:RNA polymerase sigma-70 factor (ECF subfamily)